MKQIRQESNIHIRCLMRPRGSDLLYAREEIQMMAAQIQQLLELDEWHIQQTSEDHIRAAGETLDTPIH